MLMRRSKRQRRDHCTATKDCEALVGGGGVVVGDGDVVAAVAAAGVVVAAFYSVAS